MIIFDLETLADDSHRRHLIDPLAPRPGGEDYALSLYSPDLNMEYFHRYADGKRGFFYRDTHKRWEPAYQAYHEACGNDEPIETVIKIFESLAYENHVRSGNEIEIWSGMCESVREKTQQWLDFNVWGTPSVKLKMRPIGNDRPICVIKQEWLNQYRSPNPLKTKKEYEAYMRRQEIQMVFASDPESIAMYRRNGIFVFDCRQK